MQMKKICRKFLPIALGALKMQLMRRWKNLYLRQYSSIKDALAVRHSNFKRNKETLKVSPNEVFEDILAHFKSSTFDPLSTLRISYDGQPAADTGGVLHQCFSDAFQRFSEKWFTKTGTPYSRAPLFLSDIL